MTYSFLNRFWDGHDQLCRLCIVLMQMFTQKHTHTTDINRQDLLCRTIKLVLNYDHSLVLHQYSQTSVETAEVESAGSGE